MSLYKNRVMNISKMQFNKSFPKIESIKLNKNSLELAPNQKEKLVATITPDKTTQKEIEWTSVNPKIVKVDKHGNIQGITDGVGTVRVYSVVNPNVYAECKVTVKTVVAPPEPTTT